MRSGSSGDTDTSTLAPAAAARSWIEGSSRRVRPRPAAGLTITVHGTAGETTERGSSRLETSVQMRRRGRRAARRAVRCPVVAHLDPTRVPRHVAIVMDGNGRWAQRRGLKRTDGHAAGEAALFDTIEG